jgi:hypothetical protein
MVRIPARVSALTTGAIAAGVFVVAWLYRFNDPGGSFAYLTDDHFFYLVRGWQILFSELPVRDFVDHGAPLFYYVGAAVQVLFGRGTLAEITFCVTVLAACASGVFLLAALASGSRLLGLMAAALHILLEPRFYNYPKILVYVAAIPAMWAFADRPDRRRAAILAAITAVAFLFRHDHGVFVAAAFAVQLALLPSLSWGQRIRHAAIYGALVAALLAPYLIFIELNGGIATYLRTAAAWAERDRDRAEVVWPGLFDNPDGVSADAQQGEGVARIVAVVRDNAVAWTFYAELALPIVALVMLWMSSQGFRPGWPNASTKLATVAVLGMFLNAGFLRSPLAARLADPSVPHAILVAWLPVALGALWWRRDVLRPAFRRPVPAWAVRAMAAIVVAPVLAVLFIAVTRDWYDRLDKASMVEGRRKAVERAEYMWDVVGHAFPIAEEITEGEDSVMALAHYVHQCTRPTDRVFMQHYLPQVLALAERGFAGGHADLRPGFFKSEEMQRQTLARLQRQHVPIALVGAGDSLGGFRDSFPLIARYFDEHFHTAGERAFDVRFQVRLLAANDVMPTGTFEPFGWPCFR